VLAESAATETHTFFDQTLQSSYRNSKYSGLREPESRFRKKQGNLPDASEIPIRVDWSPRNIYAPEQSVLTLGLGMRLLLKFADVWGLKVEGSLIQGPNGYIAQALCGGAPVLVTSVCGGPGLAYLCNSVSQCGKVIASIGLTPKPKKKDTAYGDKRREHVPGETEANGEPLL
jgi:hypothetical protein